MAAEFHTRATTPRGLARNRSAWSRSSARTKRASVRSSGKVSGFSLRRRRGRQNRRSATSAMRICSRSPMPSKTRLRKSPFRWPNGAGKTTLFRMITGQDKPDKGTIKIGESVHLGYVDQSRDSLDGKKTVWEEISNGNDMILLGKKEMNSRAYCASFNFKGADQQKKVGTLSGGERNRVHLAKML